MVVRMCKVLATPRSWYVCLAAEIGFFKQNFWVDKLIFLIHLHTHAMGELFCGSQPTATTCEKRNCSPTPFYSESIEGAFNSCTLPRQGKNVFPLSGGGCGYT